MLNNTTTKHSNQNKMSNYRIKIEEKYNGDKWYIPQICELEITGGWIRRQHLVWYNLSSNHDEVAKHPTEERAMKVINDHKNYVDKEKGKQIKSTTYKTIK